MSNEFQMAAEWVEEVAKIMAHLKEMPRLEEFYIDGRIRIVHKDGWQIGYAVQDDFGGFSFVAEYKEPENA